MIPKKIRAINQINTILSKHFHKKRHITKVYLFSCYGGRGGKASVTYAFKKKTNCNVRIFASKESVSFRKEKEWRGTEYNYTPRYSKAYIKEHGKQYYYSNPVKEITEW